MNPQARLIAQVGLFGSIGSVLGKLAGFYGTSDAADLLAKLLLLAAMVASNTVGCRAYVRALAAAGSSLPVTVASCGVNYFCSALIGWLVFGETLSLRWWCGASLVLLGLTFICSSPSMSTTKTQEEQKAIKAEDRKQQ